MDDQVHRGLMAIGSLAALSVIFTTALLSFITWRMISWKSYYTSFIGRNQCIVLIYQLILADLLQALGFLISFHWASAREILGPDPVCFAQGWLIQLGDVASGFFVLAIALHTCCQVTLSRSIMQYRHFMASICGIWAFSLLLTALAPAIGGRYVFLRAGSWCWISEEHDGFRLGLHYIWIFIVQFGSILVYVAGFYSIYRGKYASSNRVIQGASSRVLRRAATAMLAYACAYTVLTLPLAAGRMATMSHRNLSPTFYLVAGCLFTSSGWVDALLYTLTRRSLLFQELDPDSNHRHHNNDHNNNNNAGGGGAGEQTNPDRHRSYYSANPQSPTSLHRASSTDSILGKDREAFGGGGRRSGGGESGRFGGIKVDTTVNVVLDDLESSTSTASTEAEGRGGGRERGVMGAAAHVTTADTHTTRMFGI
ncbi:putative integral membrane protein [Eutypa lata UCREL1]|uniref:Putative integral membrane protein n=1 Tax=Eutypa lata (strain UCR-EL1) TaxID=1287681 RepID=M7T2C5_EUTLA|nr:putative integral membrane protein [Eutypa lata UCREL1]